jgi:hypothetical protein
LGKSRPRSLDAGVDYIFLLNNDAVLSPVIALRFLISAAKSYTRGGILSAADRVSRRRFDIVWYGGGEFVPPWGRGPRHTGWRQRVDPLTVQPLMSTMRTGCAMLIDPSCDP